MTSRHYNSERVARERLIKEIGIGTEVATFRVDRNHPNGAELHTITTTGIIIIRNERTHKMVTKLIARPGQIRRYPIKNAKVVEQLVEIAKEHQIKRYNEV